MSLPGDEQPNPQWQQPQPSQWQQPQQQQWQQPQSQWQQPQSQWQQPQPPPGWRPAPPTPGSAIAALILSLVAFMGCPLLPSILAVIFGTKALNDIDASGGNLGGRGVAMAGLIIGWVGIGLCALVFILLVAIATL